MTAASALPVCHGLGIVSRTRHALTPVMAAMVPSPAWMFTGEPPAPPRPTEDS